MNIESAGVVVISGGNTIPAALIAGLVLHLLTHTPRSAPARPPQAGRGRKDLHHEDQSSTGAHSGHNRPRSSHSRPAPVPRYHHSPSAPAPAPARQAAPFNSSPPTSRTPSSPLHLRERARTTWSS